MQSFFNAVRRWIGGTEETERIVKQPPWHFAFGVDSGGGGTEKAAQEWQSSGFWIHWDMITPDDFWIHTN